MGSDLLARVLVAIPQASPSTVLLGEIRGASFVVPSQRPPM